MVSKEIVTTSKQELPQQQSPLNEHKAIQFLKAVIDEKDYLKRPPWLTEDNWARGKNIVGIYYGSQAILEDIAEQYQITKERVRQIRNETLILLWLNCSTQTRAAFPLKEILVGKSLNERSLEKWKLPHNKKSNILEQLIREATNDEELQKLLLKIPLHLYKKFSQGENPLLIPITRITKSLSFHHHLKETRLFEKSLKQAGVPVGEFQREVKVKGKSVIQRYVFIASQHQERAVRVWVEDPNLQRFFVNPVTQVCGPEVKYPTVWELIKKRGWQPTSGIFAEFGARLGGELGLKPADFFTSDCPVPVFQRRNGSGHFYPVGQKDNLRNFLAERLRELKSLNFDF